MRWLTLNPAIPEDVRLRQSWLDRADRFWQRFTQEVKPTAEAKQNPVPPMLAALADLSEEIMWELAPPPQLELTLTCESAYGLRPFVNHLVGMAPDIPNWQFYAYRPALPPHLVRSSMESKMRRKSTLAGVEFQLNQVGRIEASLLYPLLGAPSRTDHEGTFVTFSEGLFGEEAFDHWLSDGPVRRKLVKVGDSWLGSAFADFKALKSQQLASRPTTPWRSNPSDQFALLQNSTPRGPIIVTSRDVALATAQVMDLQFSSSRLSTFGETFAYLHLPRFDDVHARGLIEERVQNDLERGGLGSTTGAQTRPTHSRIDIAIEDLTRIEELRATLQGVGLPNQTWLLFYDRDLQDEWMGFPDDQAPPPQQDR